MKAAGNKGEKSMKRRICLIIAGIILVAILAFAFYKLSAGDSFEKTLVSSEW